MYINSHRRLAPSSPRRRSSLDGFWADAFATHPEVVVSAGQREIMGRWPETAKTYRMSELIPFLGRLAAEAGNVLAKTSDVTSRRSIGSFGPSDELLDKISDIETAIGRLSVKMAKRIQFAKAKAAEGYTAIEFPGLRKDAFALMSLTHSLDFLVELEGGPSWIGSALLSVVDAFSRSGAWLIDVGAKIAKPLFALLSNVDVVVWGGLGILGFMWWRRRKS